MKKSTNKYRKCANCPHRPKVQSRCCCQSSASTLRNRAMTSRPQKQKSIQIENTSLMDTTIPTIMAEYSALRTENNQLKRQLLNVSAFLREDTLVTLPSANEVSMGERLFAANRSLKQAMLEVDNLSKKNKQLNETNTHLEEECQSLKVQLAAARQDTQRYRRKCKKIANERSSLISRQQLQALLRANAELQSQLQDLRQKKRINLSPQWVAHTNSKLSRIQNNIVKIEKEQERQTIDMFRKNISQTINLMRNESGGQLMGSQKFNNLNQLVEGLLRSFGEAVLGYSVVLYREMARKLSVVEKRVICLSGRIQNMAIGVRNKQMKKKLGRQRIAMTDVTNRVF